MCMPQWSQARGNSGFVVTVSGRCMPGGYTGWVYGWVVGRAIPGTQPAAKGGPRYSEAGPVSPCRGLEWVVPGAGIPCAPGPTLACCQGPVGPCGPSLVLPGQMPPPGQ